jgi:mono/diheme cytochrome c family protein
MSRLRALLRRAPAVLLLALVVVGAGLAAIALHRSDPDISPALAQRQPDVAHGAYVAVLGDCAACHTAVTSQPLAGGVAFRTSIGVIYSTNITPDATGIGRYDFGDFVRAMRLGVRPDGRHLYPVMPYTAFARVRDEDLQDLFAYLQHGITPVRQVNRQDDIAWPLSMRWSLALWNLVFLDTRGFIGDPAKGERWNRGAYLVEGLGHCGTCHTPRGFAYQEEALGAGDGKAYLSGGMTTDGWIAPSLRNDTGGLAGWSASDIVELLKSGRNPRSAVFGGMNEIVAHSLQYAKDADLTAIAAFLASLGPNMAVAPYAYDGTIAQSLFNGHAPTRGAEIYVDRCAGCHRTDGRGYARVMPTLAGNPLLQTSDATNPILIVLRGSRVPATTSAPSTFTMAPYADLLTNREVAEVVTFIQTSWGNRGAPASAAQVAALRQRHP